MSGQLPSISERMDLTIVPGPQPPPYAVDDPLDSSTASSFHNELNVHELPSVHTHSSHGVPQNRSPGHNAPISIDRSHNAPQTRNSYYDGRQYVPDIRVSVQHNGPRVSSFYNAYDNPTMDSSFDGQPPQDESDAPPSYEDAVSSTV